MTEPLNDTVSIRLFGQPTLDLPDYSGTFPSRGFALFAILATSPGNRISRASAADRIWRSSSDAASLANLRQLLKRMQTAKPDLHRTLDFDARSVWLVENSGAIDLLQFLRLDQIQTTQNARLLMDLYRGPILDGLDFAGCRFGEELPAIRSQFANRYFSLLESGLGNLTRYGRIDRALILDLEHHAFGIEPERVEFVWAFTQAYGSVGQESDVRRLKAALDASETKETPPAREPAVRVRGGQPQIRSVLSDTSLSELPRVAVMAPTIVSENALSSAFARSFIEDLANELSRDQRFRTLAAHSTFQAQNDGGVPAKNDKLRADFTVHCKITPGPELGVLSARLVDVANGTIIWSDSFAIAEAGLFTTGRRLVGRVAVEITSSLESLKLSEEGASSTQLAYVDFLAGQRALKKCDLRSVRRARRHFLSALRRDECHSDSYSGVSFSLYLEWLLTGGNEPRLLSEARELADTAILFRPQSSSGHWRKAMVSLYQHDFDTSEECFEIAHCLHPNSADILLDQGDAMGFVGSPDHAWQLFEKAIDLNPLPPEHYWWAGASIAFSMEDYTQAIELCDRLANDESVLRLLAACHGQLGNTAEARDFGQRLKETYPGQSAAEMTRLQPHRSPQDLEPFIEGLRVAGLT